MRMLTATSQGQGDHEGDYCFTVEGELVGVAPPCATDARDPDGGCGCGRGFFGMSSHRATTTATIRDLDLTRAEFTEALAGYYDAAGYGRFTTAELAGEVSDLLEVAAAWPAGTVLERRLDLIRVRSVVR
ncbi:DUF7715 family protein [Jatrophihabitans sp. YIM 134969]